MLSIPRSFLNSQTACMADAHPLPTSPKPLVNPSVPTANCVARSHALDTISSARIESFKFVCAEYIKASYLQSGRVSNSCLIFAILIFRSSRVILSSIVSSAALSTLSAILVETLRKIAFSFALGSAGVIVAPIVSGVVPSDSLIVACAGFGADEEFEQPTIVRAAIDKNTNRNTACSHWLNTFLDHSGLITTTTTNANKGL